MLYYLGYLGVLLQGNRFQSESYHDHLENDVTGRHSSS